MQIMKLFFMQFSPVSCYCLILSTLLSNMFSTQKYHASGKGLASWKNSYATIRLNGRYVNIN
jgi:hypothetical protein